MGIPNPPVYPFLSAGLKNKAFCIGKEIEGPNLGAVAVCARAVFPRGASSTGCGSVSSRITLGKQLRDVQELRVATSTDRGEQVAAVQPHKQ